jgi:hypothetical protein
VLLLAAFIISAVCLVWFTPPKTEYMMDEYFELDLLVAPAVMVADEILVAGSDRGFHNWKNQKRDFQEPAESKIKPAKATIDMKVTFFLNRPSGKTWTKLISMIPGLGDQYGVEIEMVEKTRDEYRFLFF